MDFAIAQKNRVVQLFSERVGNGKNAEIGAKRKADSKTKRLIVGVVRRVVFVPSLIIKCKNMRILIQ